MISSHLSFFFSSPALSSPLLFLFVCLCSTQSSVLQRLHQDEVRLGFGRSVTLRSPNPVRDRLDFLECLTDILLRPGVISGVGKDIIASSVGLLLKTTGLTITYVKIDPYLNQDAGTMNPIEYVIFALHMPHSPYTVPLFFLFFCVPLLSQC